MILGMLNKQVVIPIVYDKKMISFLNDVNFLGTYYDINNLPSEIRISDNKYICDIDEYKSRSYLQFLELDKFLK